MTKIDKLCHPMPTHKQYKSWESPKKESWSRMTKKHIDQLILPNGFYGPTYPHKPNILKGETHRPTRPPKWFLFTHTNQTYKKKKHIDQLGLPNGFYVPSHPHTHTSCVFFYEMTKKKSFHLDMPKMLGTPLWAK
jgi:hypothetical protein